MLVCVLSACGGSGTSIPRNAGPDRTTTATVGRATGAHLAAILRRRASGARSAQFEQVVTAGGDDGGGGSSKSGSPKSASGCTGGCTGGIYTAVPGGSLFNVGVTAPVPGNYVITGYTVDKNLVATPIPSRTVSVNDSQAGPLQEVNAAVFIGSSVDMTGGINITITGPSDDTDVVSPLCDTGTAIWDYDPSAP